MYVEGQIELQPGDRIAGYEIVKVLGRGGFGIVYEGFNHGIGHRGAIKEFFPQGIASRKGATVIVLDERDRDVYQQVREKFIETTRVLYRLSHPNIVRVHGFEERGNTAYMIMDYIEGKTVRDWLRARPGGASAEDLRAVFEPVLDAIAYLHRDNLIHRDISPDNIMVTADGKPMLIDFGALKSDLAAGSSTFSSVIVGRPSYSPPEQLRRITEPVGPYTDIFALAATMYECYADTLPLDADSRATQKSIEDVDPYKPLASIARVSAPEGLYRAIDRALELAPRRRPQDIATFRRELGWSDEPAAADDGTAILTPARPDEATVLVAPGIAQDMPEAGTRIIGSSGVAPSASVPQPSPSAPASHTPYSSSSAPQGMTPPPSAPQGYVPAGNSAPGVAQPRKSGALIPLVLGGLMIVGAGVFYFISQDNGGGGTSQTTGTQTSTTTQTATTAGEGGSGLAGLQTYCGSQEAYDLNRNSNSRGPLLAYIERCEPVNGRFVGDARSALSQR